MAALRLLYRAAHAGESRTGHPRIPLCPPEPPLTPLSPHSPTGPPGSPASPQHHRPQGVLQ